MAIVLPGQNMCTEKPPTCRVKKRHYICNTYISKACILFGHTGLVHNRGRGRLRFGALTERIVSLFYMVPDAEVILLLHRLRLTLVRVNIDRSTLAVRLTGAWLMIGLVDAAGIEDGDKVPVRTV